VKELLLILITTILFSLLFLRITSNRFSRSSNDNSPTQLPTPSTASNSLFGPVREFTSRITKKSFGTYVQPGNSPVSPEKFTGFHTGVDVEFADYPAEAIEIHSIADGLVIYSGQAQGYGGVVAIQHRLNDQAYVAVYGHLDLSSLPQVLRYQPMR
jgi:murein DD-endopeptidase MepM/ murein hydrolase activator NlpD